MLIPARIPESGLVLHHSKTTIWIYLIYNLRRGKVSSLNTGYSVIDKWGLLAQVPHSLAAECSNSKFTSRFLTMSVRVRVGFGAEQVLHCTVYWQQGQLKEQQWNTIKAFSHRMWFALCSPPGGAHTPRPSWTFFNLGPRVQKHTRHPRAVLSLAQTGSLSHPAHTYTINGSDGASLRFARSMWNRLKVVGCTAKKWATLFT